MATMQPLALMAWYQKLPKDLSNGQVRAALTKVLHRMFDQQNNFNEKGFLSIGFCGTNRKNVADWYTNNGSLYMTTLALHAIRSGCRPPILGQMQHSLGLR